MLLALPTSYIWPPVTPYQKMPSLTLTEQQTAESVTLAHGIVDAILETV